MAGMFSSNWGVFILRGLLALILGILAFAVPGPTLGALIAVFAAYAIVDGVLAVGGGFMVPSGPGWWLVVGGIAAIAVGVITIFNPETTAIVLVLFIGVTAIFRGVSEIVTAIAHRNVLQGLWLYVVNGVAAVLFGGFLVVAPGAGALAILWLIGFYAILAGILYLSLGLRLRAIAHAADTAARARAAI